MVPPVLCRGRQAITASLAVVMLACVMVGAVMIAQPAALLATDMTLSRGSVKAGKVCADPQRRTLLGLPKQIRVPVVRPSFIRACFPNRFREAKRVINGIAPSYGKFPTKYWIAGRYLSSQSTKCW